MHTAIMLEFLFLIALLAGIKQRVFSMPDDEQ
jgi:hypothetical protein